MKPAVQAPVRAIRVNVTVPVTRIGFGPFQFDPLEQMIGAKLADLLEPLMVGPVTRRPSEGGRRHRGLPARAPRGRGRVDPPRSVGRGRLREPRRAPRAHRPVEHGWLAAAAPRRRDRARPGGRAVDGRLGAGRGEAWVRLRPGMRASVPLGALGECAVEAAE